MNGLQLVVLAGLVAGAGLWLLLWRFAPAHPKLTQSLALLSPVTEPTPVAGKVRGWEAVGQWGLAKLPETLRPIPAQDLAVVGQTPSAFLAKKMAYALAGLLLPGVIAALLRLLGVKLWFPVPTLAALAAAGIGFILPDLDLRAKAATARAEFCRTLACYVDLVALERSCGSGTKQALDVAAEVGDSWVFRRLRECLDHSTWAGQAGWDGLHELADQLGVPELADVSEIMRLSGAEGAGIYRILRAKARSIREGLVTTELTRANEANEKMSVPVSVLGILFMAILIGPALLSMTGSLP